MLRKTMIALLATASLAMLVPEAAMARGPGGGGFSGGHGGMGGRGGIGGGMRGGSFNAAAIGGGSGIRSAAVTPNVGGKPGFSNGQPYNHGGYGWRGHGYGGFGAGLALGGLYGAYAYSGDPDYYGYDDSYYDDNGGCYIVRRQVHTPYGWRIRPVQVCG